MKLKKIQGVFETAEKEGRSFLLEHEVYTVLRLAGLPTPKFFVLQKGEKLRREDLAGLGSESVVLKVVSPLILHKSDAGGVRFVKAETLAVNKACREMMESVPGRFLSRSKKFEKTGPKSRLSRKAVEGSIRGVLVCEKVEFEDVGFGSELLAGIKNSREFGPVMTVGSGGLDVEYMNERLREGRGSSIFSVHLFDEGRIVDLIEPLAFFGKAARPFRGRKPLIKPQTLAEAFLKFARLARNFSAFEGNSPFVIEEFEVNPLVIRKGEIVPLDGLCRFSRRLKTAAAARPVENVRCLLQPGSIGIIGVSEKMNLGRIILKNVLKSGFPPDRIFVVKPGTETIEDCRCVPSVGDLPETVDLFILTLSAEQSCDVMKDIVENEKARSVIIIAGGLGEKEGTQDLEARIKDLIARGRKEGKITPVVNGGNCLGIISKPGRYDTTFIPESKLPRPRGRKADLAIISQSGAFMISRMSKQPHIEPLYAVSLGNQIDLTASDYLNFLKDDPQVRTFAVYMEGFMPGNGYVFARAVKEITTGGRPVVVYKSGRSPEGRSAASSHTASIAGDYEIFRSILTEAGAIVCEDILEFESFLMGLSGLVEKKVRGKRVGLMSNAGFECVIMADSLQEDGGGLEPTEFGTETKARIADILKPLGIDRLQDVHNPLDVTPVADDAAFCGAVEALLEDANIDCAVISPVPMTPAMQTLAPSDAYKESILSPQSFAQRIVAIFKKTDKPFVVNIDAGEVYDPLAGMFEMSGVPVFRRCDEAVRFLRRYIALRLRLQRLYG